MINPQPQTQQEQPITKPATTRQNIQIWNVYTIQGSSVLTSSIKYSQRRSEDRNIPGKYTCLWRGCATHKPWPIVRSVLSPQIQKFSDKDGPWITRLKIWPAQLNQCEIYMLQLCQCGAQRRGQPLRNKNVIIISNQSIFYNSINISNRIRNAPRTTKSQIV